MMTDIQKLFALSVINGTDNRQEMLPVQHIEWPQNTWLSKRLEKVRKEEQGDEQNRKAD